MKKFIPTLLISLAILLGAFILASSNKKENTKGAYATYSENVMGPQYYSIKAPSYIDFAGEPTPLHIDDVKERLERELLVTGYRHSNTFLMLKRKTRWFPVIEQILAEEGVPDDFKYLCVAESALANATSPAGAKGFWQFLSKTAQSYGLEVNSTVDERYHVEKSTRAACKYLKEAKNRFGNWTAAAASYNMGMAGFSRQQERQGQQDYYDVLLNSETSRYIFRILAFKEVLNNPGLYGFVIDYNDQYQPYQYSEVIVDSSVDSFASFASKYNTDYKTIKILNPWIRDSYLKVAPGRTYTVKVPL